MNPYKNGKEATYPGSLKKLFSISETRHFNTTMLSQATNSSVRKAASLIKNLSALQPGQ